MKRAALMLLLAACTASTNDYPTHAGGGDGVIIGQPGTGGTTGDGGVSDGAGGDGGVAISGRVCLLTDLRKLTSCAVRTGALKVSLSFTGVSDGGPAVATATTANDGRFTITAPLGAGFVWTVTGGLDDIMTSVMTFGTDNTIPAISVADYRALAGVNNALQLDETRGAVVVRVVRGTAAVADVSATVSPLGEGLTLYDSTNSATDWNEQRTQADGVVWIPALPLPQAASAVITLTTLAGARTTTPVTVTRDAITFVTQSLP